MKNPIATKGMGKPTTIYGKEASSDTVRVVFYDAERTARLCQRLRIQVLAHKGSAQVA